ncbi:MAG: DUF3500 domain-containing protein [Planctomycetota bacterium]|nr:DUF3500 domain-containing protein [Planctomycetota bacterium]
MYSIFMLMILGQANTTPVVELPKTSTTVAASKLIESLEDSQRSQGTFGFEDSQRLHWMYLPGDRAGLPLREMSTAQKEKLHRLLGTMLSQEGLRDLQGIYAMEVALRDAARTAGGDDPSRDPDQYELAIFGIPGGDPWAWHFEGHHLSLNFTHVDNDVTVTPLFIGVAPFEIPSGPLQGMQVLGEERDAAFKLLHSLDEAQRARAIISNRAPGDVHTRPGREDRLAKMEGIPLADLTPEQQEAALALLRQYAGVLQGLLAHAEIKRIEDAGIERIHFAWAGSMERNQPHYCRLHGPTFILEYDCIGGDPNHVHMVWHDPQRNFGADLLRQHHQAYHKKASGKTE